MTIPLCLTALLLLGSLCALPLTAGEILRWQDAEGKTHFGDRPPAGVKADIVVPKISNLAHGERPPAESASETGGKAPPAVDPVPARERCEQARRDVVVLATQRPVYRDEEGRLRVKRGAGRPDAYTGERQYLADRERTQELSRAELMFTRDCAAWPELQDRAQAEADLLGEEQCELARAALAEAKRKGVPANEEAQVRARREIAQWCGSR
jgi:hypothetical protein